MLRTNCSEIQEHAMPSTNEDRIIDRHELSRLVAYCLTHIYRLEARGLFPERIRLGANRVGWSFSEVMEWIEERKDARDKNAGECRG